MGQGGSRSVAALPAAVKVVHRGGHVERYYRTVTVDEVMRRNPRHFVATPDLFHSSKPRVLAPEVVLMPGLKVLLVPYRTVEGLRRKRGLSIPPAPKRIRVKVSGAEESASPNAIREHRSGGLAGSDAGSGAAGKEGDGRRKNAGARRFRPRSSCIGSPKVRASPRRGGGGRTPSRSSRMHGRQRGRAEEAVVSKRRVSPKGGGKRSCGPVDGKKKATPGNGGSGARMDQRSGVIPAECAEPPPPGLAGSKGSSMNKVFPVEDCEGQRYEGGDALQAFTSDSDGQVPGYGRNDMSQSSRLKSCSVQSSKLANADEQVIAVSMTEVKDDSPVFGVEQVGQQLHEEREWESKGQNCLVQGGGLQGITNTVVVNGQVSSPLRKDGADQDLFHYSSFVKSKIEWFETLSQVEMSSKLGVLSPSPQAITTRVDSVKGTSWSQHSRESFLASPRLTDSVAQVPKEGSPGGCMLSATDLEEQQGPVQDRHIGRDSMNEGCEHQQDAQAVCVLPICQPDDTFSVRPVRKTLQDLILEPVREGQTVEDLILEPIRESKSLKDLIRQDTYYSLQPCDVLLPAKRSREVRIASEDTISRYPVESSPDLFEIPLDPFLLQEDEGEAGVELGSRRPELATYMRDNVAPTRQRKNTVRSAVTGVEGSGRKSMPARKFAGEVSSSASVKLQRPSLQSSGKKFRMKLRDHLRLRCPAREDRTSSGSSKEIPATRSPEAYAAMVGSAEGSEIPATRSPEAYASMVGSAEGPVPMTTDVKEPSGGNQDENPGADRHKSKKPPGDKQSVGYQIPKLPICRSRSRFRSWKPRLRTVIEGQVIIWSPIPPTSYAYHEV